MNQRSCRRSRLDGLQIVANQLIRVSEFPGVPDREPRRVVLIFRAGGKTHRQEFLTTTQVGAVLEMAREQGAMAIELPGNTDTQKP